MITASLSLFSVSFASWDRPCCSWVNYSRPTGTCWHPWRGQLWKFSRSCKLPSSDTCTRMVWDGVLKLGGFWDSRMENWNYLSFFLLYFFEYETYQFLAFLPFSCWSWFGNWFCSAVISLHTNAANKYISGFSFYIMQLSTSLPYMTFTSGLVEHQSHSTQELIIFQKHIWTIIDNY